MRVSEHVRCTEFPCSDIDTSRYTVPPIRVNPAAISIILVSEASPPDPADYYYSSGRPLFEETTVLAFQDAGASFASVREMVAYGVYLTTAVKCAKIGYAIAPSTIEECSRLLEAEIALFPNVKAYLLMGDVAIKALNRVAKRSGETRVIPSGPTYKIRGGKFFFRAARVFPSYLQAGPSFFIEKSKRRMIAEDIAAALSFAR